MVAEQTSNIIMWVLIVFAAGFVGYFGKHLAKQFLTFLGFKPPLKKGDTQPVNYKLMKKRTKLDKKWAKWKKKQLKK